MYVEFMMLEFIFLHCHIFLVFIYHHIFVKAICQFVVGKVPREYLHVHRVHDA